MRTMPKAAGILALVLLGALASGSAMAQHYGRGYARGYGHGYGGHVHWGVSLGFPIYAPGFYPAPYYYPAYAYPAYAYPTTVIQAPPPVYVEQGAPQAAPEPAPAQSRGDWYYCAASKAYYPYVGECPSGWQRVPAQPPTR